LFHKYGGCTLSSYKHELNLELLAIYRGIGILNEYGSDTEPAVDCSGLSYSSITRGRVEELYNLL